MIAKSLQFMLDNLIRPNQISLQKKRSIVDNIFLDLNQWNKP